MAIKIEMLRCFCAAADHGSLADAAQQLGRTASAVSMMLRQFEDHIGAPLFESARKSRLTPLGEMILIEARRELEHFDRTIKSIEGMSRAEQGQVRLAVTPSVAQTILPKILRGFMLKHPGVRIDIRDTDSASVQRELTAERADIGIATLRQLPGFERELIFSDRFGVVCRVDSPLARHGSELTWKQIEDESFIANGLCFGIDDESFAPILNASNLMVPNTASILSLVRAGVGITILPELAVLPDFLDLKFLPLADCSARREVWMATPPEHMLTPAAQALATSIRNAEIPIAHR
ncbi:LysR family transcriptional regulator [Roseovarius sp. CAU 1744]|uniref:LysR family transcriptional regulator n=1 Tax=Roseovarius sp. CAU 1744 TaxID=3140368 RepID=UPI00325A96A8